MLLQVLSSATDVILPSFIFARVLYVDLSVSLLGWLLLLSVMNLHLLKQALNWRTGVGLIRESVAGSTAHWRSQPQRPTDKHSGLNGWKCHLLCTKPQSGQLPSGKSLPKPVCLAFMP